MPDASIEEKTRRKRIEKRCEVEFCANSETYKGVSGNFSINGLFIRTDKILALQSHVSIKVRLPDGSTSQLEGVVKRVENISDDAVAAGVQNFNGGMGVEIIGRDSQYIKFFMSLLGSARF